MPVISHGTADAAISGMTFSAMRSHSGAVGDRYDWTFKLNNNASPVARVALEVPDKTSGPNPYFYGSGFAKSRASTNSASGAITGDIDVRAVVDPSSWTGTNPQAVVSRWASSTAKSYALLINPSGGLRVMRSNTGAVDLAQADSSVAVPGTGAGPVAIRATVDVNNGASGNDVTFYYKATSASGAAFDAQNSTGWTQLGSVVTNAGTSTTYGGAADVEVAQYLTGSATDALTGKIYYAEVRSGLAAAAPTLVFDPLSAVAGTTSWSSSGPTKELWTLDRTGSQYQTGDIQSDLVVGLASGFVNSGTAVFRWMDRSAMYTLSSPETPDLVGIKSLGLIGFTNNPNAGGWTPAMKTLNASNAQIESGSAASSFTQADILMKAGAGSGVNGYSGDGGLATAADFSAVNDVTADESGNVYVADTGNNVIRRIDQFGVVTTLNAGTLNAPTGVVYENIAGIGYLWIADSGSQTVKRYRISSGAVISSPTLSSTPRRIAFDSVNTVYLTMSNCRVAKLFYNSASTVWTETAVAGAAGTCTSTGDGGAPSAATLSNPYGIAVNNGRIYVAEVGSGSTDGRLRRIDTTVSPSVISTVAGGGSSTTDGVAATSAELNQVLSVAIDATGAIWMGLSGDHNVRTFRDGGYIATVVSSPSGAPSGSSGDNGLATSARMGSPSGIAFSVGALWISDSANYNVRKVPERAPDRPAVNDDMFDMAADQTLSVSVASNDLDRDGAMNLQSYVVTSGPTNASSMALSVAGKLTYAPTAAFIGTDTFSYKACDSTLLICDTAVVTITIGSSDVAVVAGNMAEDTALATATSPSSIARFRHYLYFTDALQNVVRRYDTQSKQTVIIAGTGLYPNSTSVGNPAQYARFFSLANIVTTPAGDLLISDSGGYAIYQILANTGELLKVAGTFSNATGADGSPAATTAIRSPTGLALGAAGTIYFASGNQVRSFSLGGNLGTLAGSGTVGGLDGAAASARFGTVNGLAFNTSTGAVYAADTTYHAIRKISGGTVSTIAGTLGTSGAATNTTATSAYLSGPYGVAINTNNDTLWVVDTGNRSIRQFYDTPGTQITTIVGTGTANSGRLLGSRAMALYPDDTGYWVADTGSYKIRQVSTVAVASALQFTTIIGSGNAGTMPQATGLTSQLGRVGVTVTKPIVLAADGSGNIFHNTADSIVTRVAASNGTVTSGVLSSGGVGLGNAAIDGSGYLVAPNATDNAIYRIDPTTFATTVLVGAGLNGPQGVAYDSTKTNLYIADTGSHRILKWDGATLSVVGGRGNVGSDGDGDNGPATGSTILSPSGVAVDKAGNVYVVSASSTRVRMIDTNGNIATLVNAAGTSSSSGDGGPASLATMTNALSVAVDGGGNVFIPDYTNARLRKVDANNQISTAYGTGSASTKYNTTLALGTFRSPKAVTVSGSDVFFYDDASGRVVKVKNIASNPASNVLQSAKWSVSPAASGHATTVHQLSVKTSTNVVTSKLTFSVPAGTTGASPTVTSAYGVPTTVTASSPSSNVVTLTFGAPFTMTAGTEYAFEVSGLSMTGAANGGYTAGVTLYDNNPVEVGWARSTIVSVTSGLPAVSSAGFGPVWKGSSSLKFNGASDVLLSVSPITPTSATSALTVQTGSASIDNLNNLTLNVKAATPTNSAGRTIGAITPSVATGSALTATPNRWGTGITSISSTGTRASGVTGANFAGHTGAFQAFVTGADGANTFVFSTGAYIDWLQPAGTYSSTLSFNVSNGS